MSTFPDFLSTILLAQAEQRENPFVRFFLKEFYISWPMLAMSLGGLTFVIWRLLLNINGNTNMDEFLPVFQEKLEREGLDGALFATAMGLVTAIPLVFSHVLFRAWASHFEVRMKSAAQKLLVLVQAKSAAGTLTKPAPAAPIKP